MWLLGGLADHSLCHIRRGRLDFRSDSQRDVAETPAMTADSQLCRAGERDRANPISDADNEARGGQCCVLAPAARKLPAGLDGSYFRDHCLLQVD